MPRRQANYNQYKRRGLWWVQPGSTSDWYSALNAVSPPGSMPGSYFFVHQHITDPAAAAVVFGNSATASSTAGWRLFTGSSGATQMRIGNGAVNVNSSAKSLLDNTWYITHGVADGVDLRIYIDGVLFGAPTAVTAYSVGASGLGIGALSGGGSPIGSTVRIHGCGTTNVAMSSGQVATHAAQIKAALELHAPGVGATEWCWTAKDAGTAGASWLDEVQSATATKSGAGWTSGVERAPTWGT